MARVQKNKFPGGRSFSSVKKIVRKESEDADVLFRLAYNEVMRKFDGQHGSIRDPAFKDVALFLKKRLQRRSLSKKLACIFRHAVLVTCPGMIVSSEKFDLQSQMSGILAILEKNSRSWTPDELKVVAGFLGILAVEWGIHIGARAR